MEPLSMGTLITELLTKTSFPVSTSPLNHGPMSWNSNFKVWNVSREKPPSIQILWE